MEEKEQLYCVFRAETFDKEMVMHDVIYCSWMWLKSYLSIPSINGRPTHKLNLYFGLRSSSRLRGKTTL